MPIPNLQYAEDLTGLNPNNRLTNIAFEKVYTVGQPNRVIVPSKGPFFKANSVLVSVNGAVHTPLVYGADYKFVEPSPTAWRVTGGKEVYHGIVIINNNLPKDFLFSCNIIGGLYYYDNEAISNVMEAILNNPNSSPVEWATQVLNKPLVYQPTNHTQPLESVYKFGPLVLALERVADAIALNNTPAFDNLYDYVTAQMEAVMAGGAGDVPAHNLSPLAHNDIRNAIAALQAATDKTITVPTTFNVRAVPGPGEFATIAEAAAHINTLLILSEVTVKLNETNHTAVGQVWFRGVNQNNALLIIQGKTGIYNSEVTVTHQPTDVEQFPLCFENCNLILKGFSSVCVTPKSFQYAITDPQSWYSVGGALFVRCNVHFGSRADDYTRSELNATDAAFRTVFGFHGVVAYDSTLYGDKVYCSDFFYSGYRVESSLTYVEVLQCAGAYKAPANISDTSLQKMTAYRYITKGEGANSSNHSVYKIENTCLRSGEYATARAGIELISSVGWTRAIITASVHDGVDVLANSRFSIGASSLKVYNNQPSCNVISKISAKKRTIVSWDNSSVHVISEEADLTASTVAPNRTLKNTLDVSGDGYVFWADTGGVVETYGRWELDRNIAYQYAAGSNTEKAMVAYAHNNSSILVNLADNVGDAAVYENNITVANVALFNRVNTGYGLYRAPGKRGLYNFLSSKIQIGPRTDRDQDGPYIFADDVRALSETGNDVTFSRARICEDMTHESWGVFYTTGAIESIVINFEFSFPNKVTSLQCLVYDTTTNFYMDLTPGNELVEYISNGGFYFKVLTSGNGARKIRWKATGY